MTTLHTGAPCAGGEEQPHRLRTDEPGVAARRSEPEFLTLDEVLGIRADQIHALAAWLAPRTATPVPDVSQGGAGVIRRLVPLGEAGVNSGVRRTMGE
jgi:hypothetical protein